MKRLITSTLSLFLLCSIFSSTACNKDDSSLGLFSITSNWNVSKVSFVPGGAFPNGATDDEPEGFFHFKENGTVDFNLKTVLVEESGSGYEWVLEDNDITITDGGDEVYHLRLGQKNSNFFEFSWRSDKWYLERLIVSLTKE